MVIGIHGSYGFVGYHLWAYLNYKCDGVEVIRLSKSLDNDDELKRCNVIVHMAERNKGDVHQLYIDNIKSAEGLTTRLDEVKGRPSIIYTSSIHEDDDDLYGKWRRDNIQMFQHWTDDFKSIKLPNIYGPFCKPNYNSFIATFCDKIIKGEDLSVTDNDVNLLYVEDLCAQILDVILDKRIEVNYTDTVSTKYVYNTLLRFKDNYLTKNKIPELLSEFELNLFNTFRSYIDNDNRLFSIDTYTDERGSLSELVISKTEGQIFYSTTKPNIGAIRGNHFHTKRIERFCILEGDALVSMRKVGTDEVIEYKISGNNNVVFDTPVYYTHNLQNIGDTTLIACFWMNDILKENEIDDTYIESV